MRDVLGKYSTDVIGMCAFGLQLNAINDKESAFRKHGKSVFTPSLLVMIRELSWMISPTLRKYLPIYDFPQEANDFFISAFTETMKHRERTGQIRNDVVQTLIQARTDLIVNKTEPSRKYRRSVSQNWNFANSPVVGVQIRKTWSRFKFRKSAIVNVNVQNSENRDRL